jgi:hypothetical protein
MARNIYPRLCGVGHPPSREYAHGLFLPPCSNGDVETETYTNVSLPYLVSSSSALPQWLHILFVAPSGMSGNSPFHTSSSFPRSPSLPLQAYFAPTTYYMVFSFSYNLFHSTSFHASKPPCCLMLCHLLCLHHSKSSPFIFPLLEPSHVRS